MSRKLAYLIYELKGVTESLRDLAEEQEDYFTPLNDRIEAKTREIVEELEKTQEIS